jgi:hypothetical protein
MSTAIRCPNACTEPCDYPTCKCHGRGRGKVDATQLDAAIADKTEAALRAAVCEVFDPQEPAAGSQPSAKAWRICDHVVFAIFIGCISAAILTARGVLQ